MCFGGLSPGGERAAGRCSAQKRARGVWGRAEGGAGVGARAGGASAGRRARVPARVRARGEERASAVRGPGWRGSALPRWERAAGRPATDREARARARADRRAGGARLWVAVRVGTRGPRLGGSFQVNLDFAIPDWVRAAGGRPGSRWPRLARR